MKASISRRDFLSLAGGCALSLLAIGALEGCSSNNGGEQITTSDSEDNLSSEEKSNSDSQPETISTQAETVGNVAVVCFSATGTTLAQAEKISAKLGVEVNEIVPIEPYSNDDLNYNIDNCRANIEAQDFSARPAIAEALTDLTEVDTIYIGYPIWWGDAAPIMRTYIESVDLAGKKVVPFCTSGGSGIATSVSTLQSLANGGDWTNGLRLTGSDDQIDELLSQ